MEVKAMVSGVVFLAVFVIIVVGAVIPSLSQTIQANQMSSGSTPDPNWWNASWGNQYCFNVTNKPGVSMQFNWVQNITVPYQVGMKANFDDIRFIANLSVPMPPYSFLYELPYWKRDAVNNTLAHYYATFPYLLNDTNTEVCVYFNNTNATYEGNGSDVFPFFDDFENQTVLNPTLWSPYSPGNRYSYAFETIAGDTFLKANSSGAARVFAIPDITMAPPFEIVTSWIGLVNVSPEKRVSEWQWCYDGGNPIEVEDEYAYSFTISEQYTPTADIYYWDLPGGAFPHTDWHGEIIKLTQPGGDYPDYHRYNIYIENETFNLSRDYAVYFEEPNVTSKVPFLLCGNATGGANYTMFAIYTEFDTTANKPQGGFGEYAVRQTLGLTDDPVLGAAGPVESLGYTPPAPGTGNFFGMVINMFYDLIPVLFVVGCILVIIKEAAL